MEQLIIFEGVSGSGKTSLFTPVHERRNYEDLQVHRFTPTHYVYAKMNQRDIDVAKLQSIEETVQLVIPTLVVWCRPLPAVALARNIRLGDTNRREKDFSAADDAYAYYFRNLTKFERLLCLKTDVFSINDCVDQIVNELERYQETCQIATPR